MSERKLYFPGLGGNRYEIELEELQRQAYKGKIKRDDKIIVVKIKNGVTSEIETTCGQIRVVSDAFDQGEADRKAEAERKAAEKRAKEEARFEQMQEKAAEHLERKKQKKLERNRRTLTSDEPFFEPVHYAVKRFIRTVMSIIIICAVLFCLLMGYRSYRVAYNEAYELAHEEAYKHDKAYAEARNKTMHDTYVKVISESFSKFYNEVFYDKLNYHEVELIEKYRGTLESIDTKNKKIVDTIEVAATEALKNSEYFKSRELEANLVKKYFASRDDVDSDLPQSWFDLPSDLRFLIIEYYNLKEVLFETYDLAIDKTDEYAVQIAVKAGKKAGEKASNAIGPGAGMPAGFKSFLKESLSYAAVLGILIFCFYILLKHFTVIPLMLAQYRTETIKLAIINAAENGSFQNFDAPVNPAGGLTPQSINVPPQMNL